MSRAGWAIALAAVLCGCPRPGQVAAPVERVRVEELGLTFTGESDARLDALFAVYNASDSQQQLADLQWELWLDDRPFATGVRAVSVPVEPRSWGRVQWWAPLVFRGEGEERRSRVVRIGLRGSVHAYTGGFEEQLKFVHLEERVVENAP